MTNAPLETKPMRSATTNSVPVFALPTGSCDAHFHVFETGYPHVARPLYTFPEASLEQYLALTEHLGIERMVLVQPTFYGNDNALIVDVLRRLGAQRARAVVRVDEDVSDRELDKFHELGVRAIRLDLFSRAEQPTGEIIDLIRRTASRTETRGWHLQFYAPGRVVRDLLPFLADFEPTFVLDHMGYMKESEGLTDADASALLDVFRQGGCWIKLSAPYRLTGDRPLSTLHSLGRSLVQTRPDRLLWGSDWPHLPNGQRDTGELLNLLADWAPDPADRRRILVESADKLFFDG